MHCDANELGGEGTIKKVSDKNPTTEVEFQSASRPKAETCTLPERSRDHGARDEKFVVVRVVREDSHGMFDV